MFARLFAAASPRMERAGLAAHRRRLLAGLAGRVLEIGPGSGAGFPHYPAAVTWVVAVEPEPHLRHLARRAARDAPVPVTVTGGRAEALPLADGSVDAAVSALVLCSVAQPDVALRELRRVLRPGGELRFLEHVRAETPALRRAQRVADATLWPALAGGCHVARDTVASIGAAGLVVERLARFRFPERGPALPASPHVLGVARRPGPGGDGTTGP